MTFRVQPYQLILLDNSASQIPFYPHQVAMWECWEKHETMLLAAKTGSGKTRAAMLPVLKRREWAVAIYPTNELLRDQVRAVQRFATDEEIPVLVLTPDIWTAPDRADRYSEAEHVLVPIDGSLLDQWQVVMRCKSRGEALRRLLNPDKPKIVFSNPDILFLILGLRYHAEAFEPLRRYETLIIDEFHLFMGVELAHAFAMVALARGFGIFKRVILLSATPHPEVKELVDRAFRPAVIDAQSDESFDAPQRRIAVHAVEVTPLQVTADPVEALVSQIVSLKPELERVRTENPTDDYVPAVVIVNSVLSAIRLEDRLVEAGFARDFLAVIRGLSNRAVRQTRGKLLVLGTSAIEVGVDFYCDYLLFEAFEAASFLQRFGRVGRHRPGKAIALVPPNTFEGMRNLAEIDRATLEERIYAWYPSADTYAWFVTTEHGMITARTLAENLIATVERDGEARPEVLVQLREKVDAIFADHANRLGCFAENTRTKLAFQRCVAGKSGAQWLKTYRCLNRFRTSLPTVRVHDFMEQHRRRDWQMGEYEADLATLLKRAVGMAWNDKLDMMTISGIGKHRRVHASELFSDNDCGLVLETKDFPNLLLYQDGEATPISDLMGRENHVFAVVAKAEVEGVIGWRLPVFEAGKYIIAFDGAALLLLELWKKTKKAPRAM